MIIRNYKNKQEELKMTNLIHTLAKELIDMFPGGVSQDNVVDTATCYVDVELGAINADQLWDEVQRLEGGSK